MPSAQGVLNLYHLLSEADLLQLVYSHSMSTQGFVSNRRPSVVLQGQMPSVQGVLNLYHLLSESDLRQPVALAEQLLKDQNMDSDVGKSMLQLLQVN